MGGGVNMGWFDPAFFSDDNRRIAQGVANALGGGHESRPFVTKTFGTDAAFEWVNIAGHVAPMMEPMDQRRPARGDERCWMFILATANRPILLTARAQSEVTSRALLGLERGPIGLGGLEMLPGMCVHVDLSETWIGVSRCPVDPGQVDRKLLPGAVAVRIYGVGKEDEDLGEALERARDAVRADRGFYSGSGLILPHRHEPIAHQGRSSIPKSSRGEGQNYVD